MADEEVATRAPEGDAAEAAPHPTTAKTAPPSLFPGDTPAQSGPSMGDHCTTDRPLPASATAPAGELSEISSIACYISKPADYPHAPGKLLLLLTGGTGIHSANNQLQADAFAQRGFLVVMPDQFNGDPAPNSEAHPTPAPDAASPMSASLLERIKMGAAETAKSFLIDMWLARHTEATVRPRLAAVLAGARERFGDAAAAGGGVYGAGYCFGAKYVLQLCGPPPGAAETDPEKGQALPAPALRAGAIAHGTLVTREDVEGVRAPVAMACVAGDSLFPDDVREQGKASLELNGVPHEVEVFEGVPHGFAVVGDYADPAIAEKQGKAFEMMCGWLEAH